MLQTRIWAILTGVLFMLLTPYFLPAATSAIDGNELLRSCTAALNIMDSHSASPQENVGAMYCTGYVAGVVDSETMWTEMLKSHGWPNIRSFCSPTGVETGQMIRVIVKWLKDNPEQLQDRADTLIVRSLTEAFPCKQIK